MNTPTPQQRRDVRDEDNRRDDCGDRDARREQVRAPRNRQLPDSTRRTR